MKNVELLSKKIRKNILKISYLSKSAHIASSLSIVDIITTIYSKFIKKNKKSHYNWYSIPMWGMKNKSNQYKKLSTFNEIITFENHIQDGGFGSWINEILSVNVRKKKFLLQNKFISSKVIGKVGSAKFLNRLYGPK